ncbi:hypothetical protein V8C42DRAFT_310480 [Trichoderma barbatum]
MKASSNALLLALSVSAVQPKELAIRDTNARQLCGGLKVMKIDTNQLPRGISPGNLRMCEGHPLHQNDTIDILDGASLAPAVIDQHGSNPVSSIYLPAKRACYYAAPYGCTRGYCWKACDADGKWCWTAAHGGYGDWTTCKTFEDCGQDDRNFGCGKHCHRCGCSC